MSPPLRRELTRSLAHLACALSFGVVISYALLWLTHQDVPITEAFECMLVGLCFRQAFDLFVLGKR